MPKDYKQKKGMSGSKSVMSSARRGSVSMQGADLAMSSYNKVDFIRAQKMDLGNVKVAKDYSQGNPPQAFDY